MGFELRGTPQKIHKVAANLDDCRPDPKRVVRAEKSDKDKKKKKEK